MPDKPVDEFGHEKAKADALKAIARTLAEINEKLDGVIVKRVRTGGAMSGGKPAEYYVLRVEMSDVTGFSIAAGTEYLTKAIQHLSELIERESKKPRS